MDSLRLLAAAREPAVRGRPAILAAGVAHRFEDVAARVALVCVRLREMGLGAGSRVALVATNRVETVIVCYALFELGAAVVPIHPRLTPAEVDVLLQDGSSDVLLRDGDLDGLLDAGSAVAAEFPLELPPVDPESLAAVVYTSGTTGRPKGALLPRSAFIASAAASAANLGWRSDDRWLACMPLCHVGGLSILTRCLLARVPVVLEPRFDPRAVLEAVRRDRATLISVVPTMLRALLDEDRDGALALCRAVLVGGAAAPISLLEECARRGVAALTTYGLTEACSQVTSQRPRLRSLVERGSGCALPGVELCIIRETREAREVGEAAEVGGAVEVGEAFEPAAADEVGRILIRGPSLMRGYFPRGGVKAGGELPARATSAWLDTGDLGALDESSRLHVHARRTDLIVTGGENVYPLEVEQAIEATPGVLRALVFGVPDERWGQLVAAAVVPNPAAAAAVPACALEARLFAGLRARLAPHKRPRRLCFVEALPLTAAGKLDRASAPSRFAHELRPFPPEASR